MQKYRETVLNSNGQPVASATVVVRPTGSTSTATIYATNTGSATVANPLTADANGQFSFYGTNGRYDLVISGNYIQTTTVTDILLDDVPLSNLSELTTASAARSNIGVGSLGQQSANAVAITGGTSSNLVISSSTISGMTFSGAGAKTFPGTSSASLGYLGIPVNVQAGTYTTVLSDQGGRITNPSTATGTSTFTLGGIAGVGYPGDTAISFVNLGTAALVLVAADTMTLANSTSTGARSLARNGIATAVVVGTGAWLASGAGLT